MPYIETLKVLQTGNTSTGIFETMALLLNLTKDLHRVSFVRDREGSRLSVGDSLDLASPTSGKPRRKRWWEQKKETGQLRLPFSLYEPAKIIHVSYDNNSRQMKLKLRFVNVAGVEKTITFYHDGHASLDDNGIKAIRVHKVVKKWVGPTREEEAAASPFSDLPSLTQTLSSGQQSNLSQRDCEELAERAMEHGIAVTPSHIVYDDRTGECVGSEFQVLSLPRDEESLHPYRLDSGGPDPIRYISFRKLDGRDVRCRTNHSSIRFVDSRTPSSTECHNMMNVAMQNGIVVTPSGKVYEAGSGAFLGDRLNITTEPGPPAFGDCPRRYIEDTSVRVDLVMPDGEQWAFQTYVSKVTHIDREVYTPLTQSERRRSAMFAQHYGGNANDWVNAAGIEFRGNGE